MMLQPFLQLFADDDKLINGLGGPGKQKALPPAELFVPRRQRSIKHILNPRKSQNWLQQEPYRQQQRIGVFEMKMGRVQNARPSAFANQRPKSFQPAVPDKEHLAFIFVCAGISPNANLVVT